VQADFRLLDVLCARGGRPLPFCARVADVLRFAEIDDFPAHAPGTVGNAPRLLPSPAGFPATSEGMASKKIEIFLARH